jgi:hypothetical protein
VALALEVLADAEDGVGDAVDLWEEGLCDDSDAHGIRLGALRGRSGDVEAAVA